MRCSPASPPSPLATCHPPPCIMATPALQAQDRVGIMWSREEVRSSWPCLQEAAAAANAAAAPPARPPPRTAWMGGPDISHAITLAP